MNLYVYIIACCVFVAACLACLKLGYHWGRDDGYAAAEDDRKIARAEARRGRHARTQPRTSLIREPAPDPAIWERPIEVGGPVPLPSRWYAEQIAKRSGGRYRVTSAADLPREVVLPEPGTYLPGPRRSTSPNTVTFPKVQLDTASTGEIRGLGDAMVAAIEAAGEAS